MVLVQTRVFQAIIAILYLYAHFNRGGFQVRAVAVKSRPQQILYPVPTRDDYEVYLKSHEETKRHRSKSSNDYELRYKAFCESWLLVYTHSQHMTATAARESTKKQYFSGDTLRDTADWKSEGVLGSVKSHNFRRRETSRRIRSVRNLRSSRAHNLPTYQLYLTVFADWLPHELESMFITDDMLSHQQELSPLRQPTPGESPTQEEAVSEPASPSDRPSRIRNKPTQFVDNHHFLNKSYTASGGGRWGWSKLTVRTHAVVEHRMHVSNPDHSEMENHTMKETVTWVDTEQYLHRHVRLRNQRTLSPKDAFQDDIRRRTEGSAVTPDAEAPPTPSTAGISDRNKQTSIPEDLLTEEKSLHFQDRQIFTEELNWASNRNPCQVPVVSKVYNQGTCGACWAFAATSSIHANLYMSLMRNLKANALQLSTSARNSQPSSTVGNSQPSSTVGSTQHSTSSPEPQDGYSKEQRWEEDDVCGVFQPQDEDSLQNHASHSSTPIAFALKDLSSQELVDCDRDIDRGCHGGNPLYAYQYALQYGIGLAQEYPFIEQQQLECKRDAVPRMATVQE